MNSFRKEKPYWYWLSLLEEIGPVSRRILSDYFSTAEELYHATDKLLKNVPLSDKIKAALLDGKRRRRMEDEFHKLAERDIYFVTKAEPGFPQRLRDIPDSPDWLFYRGELPGEEVPSVAIIGARECSVYGKGVAEKLARELAQTGIPIISGMARGIDGYAGRAAIRCGKSYAVLGSGVDICYPMENYSLYEQLPGKGGIISEYAPGSKGAAWHFPCRNRIIAGLADGLIVVEARKKSGTLITVEYALEQGKDVFAVPGRIGEALSEGCNELIRQGAFMITGSIDIVEELSKRYTLSQKSEKNIKNKFFLEQPEKIVYAYLRLEPKNVEEILKEVDFSLPELIKILYSMEKKGIVYSPAANYYALAEPDIE